MMNGSVLKTLRMLSVDAIEKAKSGHPGLPLGAAPMALALWNEMKHNPSNPYWQNRDRFILSAGHGSALLYSLFHLFGYNITIDDLKQFRQFGSRTPGHPEYAYTEGVEITTGPLGQGIANAVGFAIGETHMASRFNKPDIKIVDHYTFCLCGDGCLQEGISQEAVSLAGTLGLGKLILLYDSNDITIEGPTNLSFTENIRQKFEACHWHVQRVEDGNDMDAILKAIQNAKNVCDKPSLIEVKTIIGYGSKFQGTANVHGAPLGSEDSEAVRKFLDAGNESFYVPEEVKEETAKFVKKAAEYEADWLKSKEKFENLYPEDYALWYKIHDEAINITYDDLKVEWENKPMPTRTASGIILNKLAALVPNLLGGSADLGPSVMSIMKDRSDYSKENPYGSNIHFGVREHAMTAIANALAAYSGLRPYVSTFFVFSDYMKPAMRLSSLMRLPVIYIFSHDTIGVGEDGPTHQPIEQLASIRSIPGFTVVRPADPIEVTWAWLYAINKNYGPTALILSRQNLPPLKGTRNIESGAYILHDNINPATNNPDIILIATGSEVHLIHQAAEELLKENIFARIISMPSMELYDSQEEEYKISLFPCGVKKIAVEAASSFGWHKYTGQGGKIISIDIFATSAPGNILFEKNGFTVQNIIDEVKGML